MNKDKITNLCHKISGETGLTFNMVMANYFLDSILHRLANSSYRDNFIFKGGFLLSNMVGIESRSTVDIDFLLKNMELSEEQVIKILSEALRKGEDSEIAYEIQEIQPMNKEDPYGGFRVKVLCRLQNIRQIVPLDIASGDIITPHPIDYRYVSAFDNENIMIKAYPIETMLAEKIQIIYARGFLNSRSKDYYDLHILYKTKKEDIDKETLANACKRTFRYRETEFDIKKITELLQKLIKDEAFLKRWKSYEKKNSFVQGITFPEVIDSALKLIDLIEN